MTPNINHGSRTAWVVSIVPSGKCENVTKKSVHTKRLRNNAIFRKISRKTYENVAVGRQLRIRKSGFENQHAKFEPKTYEIVTVYFGRRYENFTKICKKFCKLGPNIERRQSESWTEVNADDVPTEKAGTTVDLPLVSTSPRRTGLGRTATPHHRHPRRPGTASHHSAGTHQAGTAAGQHHAAAAAITATRQLWYSDKRHTKKVSK